MKSHALLLLLGLAVSLSAGAQNPSEDKITADFPRKVTLDEVGTKDVLPQKMPTFKGGNLKTFRSWVQRRLKYPDEAFQQEIQGRVVVRFLVDKDGKVCEAKVLESPSPLFSEEVLRVMSKAPAWTPGEQDGKRVGVNFSMPLDFKLK